MEPEPKSLYHDDEQLDDMRDHVVNVIGANDVSNGHAAIAFALVYVGDCLLKGFDLLARSRNASEDSRRQTIKQLRARGLK
jgi:hypothetical protein